MIKQLANDLHALITNLRAHGVLFYRDSAAGASGHAAARKPHRHEELKAAELIETSRNAKIERVRGLTALQKLSQNKSEQR